MNIQTFKTSYTEDKTKHQMMDQLSLFPPSLEVSVLKLNHRPPGREKSPT